jgi:hypothetical protein
MCQNHTELDGRKNLIRGANIHWRRLIIYIGKTKQIFTGPEQICNDVK